MGPRPRTGPRAVHHRRRVLVRGWHLPDRGTGPDHRRLAVRRHPAPEAGAKRVEPLATEKVEALIEAMPSRYRALVVLAAGTGLRQGEALAVEVEAVDWLRRTLRVDRQLVLLPGGEPYIALPKTPASYRTVPLPQIVVDALAAHLATFPAARVEILDATHKPDPSGGGPRWCSPARRAGRCGEPGSRTSGGLRRPLPGSATR